MKRQGKRLFAVLAAALLLMGAFPVSAVSYRYEFSAGEVTEKDSNSYFTGFSRGSATLEWRSATFAGEEVLSVTPTAGVTETGDTASYQEDVSGWSQVMAETRVGYSSDSVPHTVGLVPVFNDGNARVAQGVRVRGTNYIAINGAHEIGQAAVSNQLTTIGFAYDKNNKIMREYYVAKDGSTVVYDVHNDTYTGGAYDNLYVNAGSTLQGVAIYTRLQSANPGPAYWDYLHIADPTTEPFAAVAEKSTVQNEQVNVSADLTGNPIDIYYNYVIDPEKIGQVTLRTSNQQEVPVTVSTYNGHNVRITASDWLKAGETYTLTLTGVTDLLGYVADDYTATFTTVDSVAGTVALTTNGGELTAGENTVRFTLTAASAAETTPVTLMLLAFDKETEAMLGLSAASSDDITKVEGRYLDCTLDTTVYPADSYYLEAYVWDGVGSMRPYLTETIFGEPGTPTEE